MLLALRDNCVCQEVLCAMLELDVVENNDHKLQIVTTLQSTKSGQMHYAALCERQMHLRELVNIDLTQLCILDFKTLPHDLFKTHVIPHSSNN